ncbi:hypothetical protein EFL87_06740 [Weissella confusa]|uniref:hypothetical protein n=1 Tax=Weissella confusa TaxID=1583 RepID=UPI00223AA124|nr:hypothetical protein [Weissella confusa]MCT0042171.1 hypothetical protein [Weissella confusa]
MDKNVDNTDKRFYLTQIQDIVKRMGSNSFVVKGWFITLVTALYAYYFHNNDYRALVGVLIVSMLFWYHDAYYLALERSYRNLYKRASKLDSNDIDFYLGLKSEDKESIWSGAFRPILLGSYGVVVVGTIIVLVFIFGVNYGKQGIHFF